MVVNPQLNDDVQVSKKCFGHSSILLVPALIYKFGRTRHLSLGRLIKQVKLRNPIIGQGRSLWQFFLFTKSYGF